VTFGDDKTANAILQSNDPEQQKRYGKHISGYDRSFWNTKSRDVVKKGNIAKVGHVIISVRMCQ
jgi:predicted NAD-dependent protein-ADP-ribosyltransferase YbiA (DUF1768 family)